MDNMLDAATLFATKALLWTLIVRVEDAMSARTSLIIGKATPSRSKRLTIIAWIIVIACLSGYGGKHAFALYLRSAIFEASERGDNSRLRTLLRLGADPNSLPVDERSGPAHVPSPLVLAARNGKWSTVDILLNAGAKAEIQGSTDSALWYAVEAKDPAAVQALLGRGADPNKHVMIYTILWTAVSAGDTSIVEALLEGGADPNRCGSFGLGALCDRLDLIKLLVAHGADVNLRAEVRGLPPLDVNPAPKRVGRMLPGKYPIGRAHPTEGYTPLMVAVLRGNRETVQFLLAHGASPNVKWTPTDPAQNAAETPLRAAEKAKRKDIADLLRQAGARE
jgi:ankyrin repeat protein